MDAEPDENWMLRDDRILILMGILWWMDPSDVRGDDERPEYYRVLATDMITRFDALMGDQTCADPGEEMEKLYGNIFTSEQIGSILIFITF